ncbi:uncharacterized protein LOC119561839 isoform X2 [Drosophila subpulchrella]|uniref:uncharacterized protein LOC119561839 isoform X2 n=1 Tax=Drosophila subpulchrella TaxID=1486046 RepID=UPI0018A1704B|nr:uncharacterized protein LOC119561839 isoform X2 [Drosophila subpulchrella]
MSEDPTDLTPGHFLVGGPLLSIVEPEENGESKSIINQWQHLKALYHQFRARRKENLRVGDMVVVKDNNLPSNEWRLGRIDSVFPGADGNVRVVDIRTARAIIKRPVTKSGSPSRRTFQNFLVKNRFSAAFAPARFAKSPDACPSTAFIILDTSTVARGTSPASQRQPPPGCVGDRPDRGGDIRAPRRAPSMHPWPPFFSC